MLVVRLTRNERIVSLVCSRQAEARDQTTTHRGHGATHAIGSEDEALALVLVHLLGSVRRVLRHVVVAEDCSWGRRRGSVGKKSRAGSLSRGSRRRRSMRRGSGSARCRVCVLCRRKAVGCAASAFASCMLPGGCVSGQTVGADVAAPGPDRWKLRREIGSKPRPREAG